MDLKKLLHPWWLLPISLLLQLSNAKPQVPCYFIFGDSLSDSGNNNNLKTKAKVNYPPYGIDFPDGPTGRFSNGRNLQDVIVGFLGFEEPMPSFAISKDSTIFHGVNYASGSAGILNDTGREMGDRVPMSTQLGNHKIITNRIRHILRNESSANELLSHCIYSIQIGSNDYLNNFFKSNFYQSKQRYTLSEFTTMIFQHYSQQMQALYDMGARLFALHGLGPLGCTPASVAWFGTRASPCVDTLNNAAKLFNTRLEQLVKELNTKYKDARFTYLNTSPAPPTATSSMVMDKPCCQIGGGGGELCMPNSVPCSNRKDYLFWDGAHLTEASNVMIASGFFGKGILITECRPFNIPQLAMQLKS